MPGFRELVSRARVHVSNLRNRLEDLRIPPRIRERLAESEKTKTALAEISARHAPYRELEDALARNFHVQNGLSEEDARRDAYDTFRLVSDFLRHHSVGMNLREIGHFFREDPKEVITTMNALRSLQQLEKERAHPDRVDWPKVPHLDYNIRMGDLNKIPGGDTADLLHISTHDANKNGREVSYYWFHNLDWSGKGLRANTFREISQTFIRGFLKNLKIDRSNPGQSAVDVFSELHHYFVNHILSSDHSYFAEGHGGIIEVHHGGSEPARARMHLLNFGGRPITVHDPANTVHPVHLLTNEVFYRDALGPFPEKVLPHSNTFFLFDNPKNYTPSTIDLGPRHTYVFHTDGIPEGANANGVFFESTMYQAFSKLPKYQNRPVRDFLKFVHRAFTRFMGENPARVDDSRMVALRFDPENPKAAENRKS